MAQVKSLHSPHLIGININIEGRYNSSILLSNSFEFEKDVDNPILIITYYLESLFDADYKLNASCKFSFQIFDTVLITTEELYTCYGLAASKVSETINAIYSHLSYPEILISNFEDLEVDLKNILEALQIV